jgi:hypothetical protein
MTFEAECPYCSHWNIFNRISDLNDTQPIAFKTVACTSCHKRFTINGDHINAAYETLIFDCYKLMSLKRYSYCILNLVQAYEAFFSQYLRVELLYKPFARSGSYDLEQWKEVAQ